MLYGVVRCGYAQALEHRTECIAALFLLPMSGAIVMSLPRLKIKISRFKVGKNALFN
jgi:hypothetical protein